MRRFLDSLRGTLSARGTPNGVVRAERAGRADAIRLTLADATEDAKPRCLISMLGSPPDNVDEILESVARVCRGNGEFPVAVMSDTPPRLIATATMPIEFIPTHRHLPVRSDEYERHVRRRWSLVIAKWEFTRQIEVGLGIDAFLAEQLSGAQAAVERDPMPSAASPRAADWP